MKATIQFFGASGLALFALLAPTIYAQEPASPAPGHSSSAELKKLVAVIRPVGDSNVRGSILFDKVDDGVMITAKIGGLTPNARHAIHIHEFGDLGSDDATSAGSHFNPEGHPHAMPSDENRHAGDLGNLEADADGNATLTLVVNNITLDAGKSGILGRAVIVHAKHDDGGQPTGNAGSRIAAGVIGISKDGMRSPATSPSAGTEQKETRPATPDSDASTE